MFTSPPFPGLTAQPRKGIGARITGGFSRLGAALRSVVAGGPRRPQSGPHSRITPDAGSPPAASQVRTPRQPSRARKGGLARLFGRCPIVAVPDQARELANFEFTVEAFPDLSPEARAFFNTTLEQYDPAILGIVLEALAELIAGSMTPREGMRDVRDAFLALSSGMKAVAGEAEDAPPAALPEVAAAPADPAATAGIDPQAASPEVPGPALWRDTAAPPSEEGTDVAQGAAAAASVAPNQPAIAPAGPQPSGVSDSRTSTKNARVPDSRDVPARHARRRLLRGRPGLATRSLILPRRNILLRRRYVPRMPQPARLLCYAACAGPPALLRGA
jgi:hypothetical protein